MSLVETGNLTVLPMSLLPSVPLSSVLPAIMHVMPQPFTCTDGHHVDAYCATYTGLPNMASSLCVHVYSAGIQPECLVFFTNLTCFGMWFQLAPTLPPLLLHSLHTTLCYKCYRDDCQCAVLPPSPYNTRSAC